MDASANKLKRKCVFFKEDELQARFGQVDADRSGPVLLATVDDINREVHVRQRKTTWHRNSYLMAFVLRGSRAMVTAGTSSQREDADQPSHLLLAAAHIAWYVCQCQHKGIGRNMSNRFRPNRSADSVSSDLRSFLAAGFMRFTGTPCRLCR